MHIVLRGGCIKRIIKRIKKAIYDYNMVEAGDKIAVGLSGGKDSLLLLCALSEIKRHFPIDFELIAVTLLMGKNDPDYSPIALMCKESGIDYHIINTEIARVVFDERNEKNPCSLCANMRRGALNGHAKKLGCNKLALGHHRDDVLETFLMSTLYEGRIHTFSPVTYLDRIDITVIRPMIYIDEIMITDSVKKYDLHPVDKTCKIDGHTNRQYMKDLLGELQKKNPEVKNNLFGAIKRAGIDKWKE